MNKTRLLALLIGVMITITGCSNTTSKDSSLTNQTTTQETTNTSKPSPVAKTNEIISSQAEQSELLKTKYKEGTYTLEKPYVVLDPYGVSPLTAMIGFSSKTPGHLDVTIKGKDELSTITHTFSEVATEHLVPIYGLYADKNNEVVLTFTDEKGTKTTSTVFIQTQPLPDDMPKLEVVTMKSNELAEGLTMASSSYMLGYDSNGDIRWFLDNSLIPSGTTPIKKLKNGNLIFIAGDKLANYSEGNQTRTGLYEVDLLGRLFKEYIVDGVHHEVHEMPSGDLLVSSQKDSETNADYIVQIDRETGEIVSDFDMGEIFDVEEIMDPAHLQSNTSQGKPSGDNASKQVQGNGSAPKQGQGGGSAESPTADWFHNNAVWYDETDNSVLISGKSKDVIIKVDAETKEIIWILGDPNIDWATKYADKMLTPVGKDFEYPYASHAVKIIDGGDILLFDNGNVRSKDPSTVSSSTENYSRAVRYKIDEKAKTVTQVWEYGKERGKELFCTHIGDADYLGENHYLITFGAKNTIIEIKNDVVVSEVKFAGRSSIFRSEKESLYDEQSTYINLDVRGTSLGKSHYVEKAK